MSKTYYSTVVTFYYWFRMLIKNLSGLFKQCNQVLLVLGAIFSCQMKSRCRSNIYGIVFSVTAYVITDLIGHKTRPVMDY